MGMNHTVYVGAYITYEMPLKKNIEYFYACPKKGCDGNKDMSEANKFCTMCGNKIKKLSRENTSDTFDIWEDFLEPFEESLCNVGGYAGEDENVLLPNRGEHGQRFDHCDFGCFDLEKEKELKGFKKQFKKEIEVLKKLANKVEVHWGVVCYAM